MKKITLALTTLSLTFFANSSFAKKSYDDRLYIAPSLSYLWLDDDRLTSRSGHGVNLGLGKAVSQNTNLELKAFYNRYQNSSNDFRDNNFQWDTYGLSLDWQYYLSRKTIQPYLVAGVGAMNSRIEKSDALGVIGEAGVGLAYKISKNFSLRSDVRYRYNNNFNKVLTDRNRDRFNDMVVNLGVVIPFGHESKDHHQGKTCHKNKVEKTTLEGVTFETSSDVLTNEAESILDRLATKIIKSGDHDNIEIHGHTDSTGNDSYNLSLSQKRAKKVADYLAKKGVTNKITSKGFGETKPIASNKTKSGRLQNRRVELIWK